MDSEKIQEYLLKAITSLAESNKIQASHASGLTPAQLARTARWTKQNQKDESDFAEIDYEPIWIPANSANNRSDKPILDTTDVESVVKSDIKDILPDFDRTKEPETLTKQQSCVEAAIKKAFHNCSTHEFSAATREGMAHFIAQSLAMARINNFMLASIMKSLKENVETGDVSEKFGKPCLKLLTLLAQTASVMKNEASAISGTLKEKDFATAEAGMLGLLARTPIKSNKVSQSHSFQQQTTLKKNQNEATKRGLKRKKAIETSNNKKQKASQINKTPQTTNTSKKDSKISESKSKESKDGN